MASISKVKIANMALSHIGDDSTIESFTEESTQAKQVNLWYDYSRRMVLEAFDWSFARKRVIMAVIEVIADDSTDPQYGEWVYRYQYPVDCLNARRIKNPLGKDSDAVPFELETSEDNSVSTVLTDMEDAVLVYTFDAETTTLYSSFFVETLSVFLAYKMAFSLTGNRKLASDMLNVYQGMIGAAPAVDANQRVSAPPREAEWIRSR